jgi:hypothetical protein
MARYDSHRPRTGSAAARGGLGGLAAGAIAASVLLVLPIAVWARVGDGSVPGAAAVTAVALGACFGLLCWTTRRYVRRRFPAQDAIAPVQTQWSPSTYRGHSRPRVAMSRPPRRSTASPHRCAPSRCRPAYVSRFPRDMGCRASSRNLQRRTARRRTRP